MEYDFCGVILEVSYPSVGNTARIDVLGKKISEWIVLALGGNSYRAVAFREGVEIPVLARPYAKSSAEFTVVLYSDTPLITKKTVYDAITTLVQNNLNVLKLTRGWVFRTSYLLAADKIYSDRIYFFEEEDFITVFNFKQLAMAREFLKNRIINFHLENGVDIEDIASTFIGPDVTIGKGVTISPGNHITGTTIIKDDVYLGPNNNIKESIISDRTCIEYSVLEKCYIGERTEIGPYAYIRPGSIIGNDCRIGDFVEIKNSKIGDNSKLAHLTYAGDCEIGTNCNIGCGVVFANYNGEKKYKSVVGNNVFIGSNCNIIAPLIIGDGAFLAAGSTFDKNIPARSLAIARARQENKLEWDKNPYYKP